MITPFYQGNYSTVFCGDAREVLKELPEASVDMAMCSPPYYGLRKYLCEPSIWDGDEKCKHEWGENEHPPGYRKSDTNPGALQSEGNSHRDTLSGQFCRLCGAWKGILGMENSPGLYIQHLVGIFDLVRRVLKPTGTLWVNLSDSYAGGGTHHGDTNAGLNPIYRAGQEITNKPEGVPDKSLIGIPARFQIAMIDKGWICRNDLIWWKRSCMPESVRDRFTRDWEHIFFFSASNKAAWWVNEKTMRKVDEQPPGTHGLEGMDWEWVDCPRCSREVGTTHILEEEAEDMASPRARYHRHSGREDCPRCKGTGKVKRSFWHGEDYYFEQQFEPIKDDAKTYLAKLNKKKINKPIGGTSLETGYTWKDGGLAEYQLAHKAYIPSQGRNKRTVWDITSQGTKFEHYASYPPKLCETPILAGCPEYLCPKCGKAREKMYRASGTYKDRIENGADNSGGGSPERLLHGQLNIHGKDMTHDLDSEQSFIGYSDCGCGTTLEQCVPGVVLDCFMGTGTTLYEAKLLGRKSIGVDISEAYCEMAVKRLKSLPGVQKGLG